MKIVWKCRGEVKRSFAPLLKKWEKLAPSWCHVLYCDFSKEGASEGVIASITPLPEYRKAYLYVHPVFLEYDEEERERAIVHEMLHLQVAPLDALAESVIRRAIAEDSILFEWAREEQRRACEGVVEDLRVAFSAP